MWKFNLPYDLQTKIGKNYGKLCGNAIFFKNEINYAIESDIYHILLVESMYDEFIIDLDLIENCEIWDYLDDD